MIEAAFLLLLCEFDNAAARNKVFKPCLRVMHIKYVRQIVYHTMSDEGGQVLLPTPIIKRETVFT